MRIVSLFPAATEIVCALGLERNLVGLSHACPRTGALANLPRLTAWRGPENGTAEEIDAAVTRMACAGEPLFEFDAGLLMQLRPDIVLSQSLCDVCAIDEPAIRKMVFRLGSRMWEWLPRSVDDVLNGIVELATICDRADAGEELSAAIRCRLFNVRYLTGLISEPPRVVFLEWLAPLYCAGHWIPELIEFAGATDVLGSAGQRSQRIAFEDLEAADPDVIVVGCCGCTVARTAETLEQVLAAPRWQELRAVRTGRVHVVDAENCYTAPGPSIADAVEELAKVIHFEKSFTVSC